MLRYVETLPEVHSGNATPQRNAELLGRLIVGVSLAVLMSEGPADRLGHLHLGQVLIFFQILWALCCSLALLFGHCDNSCSLDNAVMLTSLTVNHRLPRDAKVVPRRGYLINYCGCKTAPCEDDNNPHQPSEHQQASGFTLVGATPRNVRTSPVLFVGLLEHGLPEFGWRNIARRPYNPARVDTVSLCHFLAAFKLSFWSDLHSAS